ncbi:MAG: SDR family oxidoreductase [Planctomycetota bacterium]
MTVDKLIIGCGYVGRRVAAAWLAEGAQVAALTRSTERAEQWRSEGLQPLIGDITSSDTLELPAAETVLVAVGYDRRSKVSMQTTYVDGLANVLAAIPSVRRVVYISSTGVYGQTDDEWVDETSPCEPTREGGQACLAAEQLLPASPCGDRYVILRLAGIYGPGRVPAADQAASRLDLNPTGYLNLIHVNDAVQAVLQAESYGPLPDTFIVSDGHPVRRADYYRKVVELFAAPGTSLRPTASTPGRSRPGGSKRLDNRRLLTKLRVTLRYPTYAEGLAAIAAGC